MARLRKKVLCYTLTTSREYNYDHLVLFVYVAEEQSVKALFDGTVDNKAGYGSKEAADRLGRWYRWLLDQGHKIVLESLSRWSHLAPPSIEINWQVYKPDNPRHTPGYCEPRIRLGDDRYNDIQNGAKELKRIGRKIERLEFERTANEYRRESEKPREPSNYSFEDPVEVIEALEAMGAKRVKRIRGDDVGFYYDSAVVYSPERREWLLTDSLQRTMEIR